MRAPAALAFLAWLGPSVQFESVSGKHRRVGDHRTPRVLVSPPLREGGTVTLSPEQTRHVVTVLRARDGAPLRLIDGENGEFAASLRLEPGRGRRAAGRAARADVGEMLRAPAREPGPTLLFAPLKPKAMALLAEKATELGVAELWPTRTARTELGGAEALDSRLRTAATEAAVQCERLTLPDIRALSTFDDVLHAWPADRPLLVAVERAVGRGVAAEPLLRVAQRLLREGGARPPALWIGPEGGWTDDETEKLTAHAAVRAVSLGPRILRAETAALAALATIQAADLCDDPPAPP